MASLGAGRERERRGRLTEAVLQRVCRLGLDRPSVGPPQIDGSDLARFGELPA